MRRNDTSTVGDLAESEAIRLLGELGWSAANLNLSRRNYRLYDLVAVRDNQTIQVSVKHARAKRHIRLGNPNVFRDLRDEDFLIVFLPKKGAHETDIVSGDYDVWVVPGSARHIPLAAHLHYYGGDSVAASQRTMMIKDKIDTAGGRSISGAAFRAWEDAYKDAWQLLGSSRVAR